MLHIMSAAALVFVLIGSISAATSTTWFPKEFECPIDHEKNTFLVVGSYGSYIYSYPSKYQWLFFPQTDSPTFYLCKKCHLATYMWDFDKLPKEKLASIQKILANIKISKGFTDYQEIPITERLEIMEKVYAVLDKDDDWWETFHRVKGYHYAGEGKADKALEERKKSLELIAKLIKDENSIGSKKLKLYISGAMKHFTNDDAGAIADFQMALATKFFEKEANAEELENGEKGINERVTEYIELIKSDKKPRLMDGKEGN